MSGKFARKTTVPVAQSRGELESLLEKYGADKFGYTNEVGQVQVAFRIKGKYVRLDIPMPRPDERQFAVTPTGMIAVQSTRDQNYRQATMQVWRAIVLVVKAKLEAVEIGISTIEREFLANIVMPGGDVIGDVLIPQIEQSYLTGEEPKLLTSGT